MDLQKILEQSYIQMLKQTTRWKFGVYQSMRRAKLASTQMIVPIQKIWDPDRIDEPEKKVDYRRCQVKEKCTFKETKKTNCSKVTRKRSTSKAPEKVIRRMYREQESINVFALKDFMPRVIDLIFGDTDND